MSSAPAPQTPSGPLGWVRTFFDGLAGRLLVLTAIVVLASEILIFVPVIAAFHENWLRDRINLAQIAALALEASPETEIADSLEYELLTNAEVRRVAMQREGERELLLESSEPLTEPLTTYDYTNASVFQRFAWAVETFFASDGRILRVMARPRFESGEFIEIVLNEAALKRDMFAFARQFALISTLIFAAAAALVYGALTYVFVRPMRDFTAEIERFRDRPEDVSISFVRSRRADEIGRAERAAHAMAEQVRMSLRQRERLAALGSAVAKIGHDLRNMLATAQLVADRLAKSDDPIVRQVAPRLERTIDRAAALASSTLKYGRADEAPPQLQRVEVAPVAEEAALDALTGFDGVQFRAEIDEGLACIADPEHLHRILVNLIRNGAQAMRHHEGGRDKLIIARGIALEGRCEIDVIDRGAGVKPELLEKLYDPFVTADAATGGTGLGLAIARELTRAMGGDLLLFRTGAEGATFRIILPGA